MSLKVLITNYYLSSHSGTELYTRDLALELQRQGHIPTVYSPWLGPIAHELSKSGVKVTDSLKQLDSKPDIIHAHHRCEAISVIKRFPGVPVIYVCHDHTSKKDIPPLHSRIVKYFGVSELCIKRLRDSGIVEDKIGRIYNFVDLKRFKPRSPLPDRPRRALVFSNYAKHDSYLPSVSEACRLAGIDFSVIGRDSGTLVTNPEDHLGSYDIVFAKAKAAMEAMAVGCAVVLCDYGGVGPMVSPENFSRLRALNFGFQALTKAHTADNLLAEIERYDAKKSETVRDIIRAQAGLTQSVKDLVEIYIEAMAKPSTGPKLSDLLSYVAMWRYYAELRWKKFSYRSTKVQK